MGLFEIGPQARQKATDSSWMIADDAGSAAIICKSPAKLKTLVDSMLQATTIQFVSDGDWSMHDLFNALLPHYAPCELWFSTYTISEFAIRQIVQAQLKKDLLSVHMLIDYRAKVRTPEAFHLAENNVNRIRLTPCHAKVMVIRSNKGCISVVCSANWTKNPRIEAGVISRNEQLAAFHIDWLNKTLDNADIFQ